MRPTVSVTFAESMGCGRIAGGKGAFGCRRLLFVLLGLECTECAEKEPADVLLVAREREDELNVEEVMLVVLSR